MFAGFQSITGRNRTTMRRSYIGSNSSSATTQTVTFSAQSIGAAYDDRYIFVVVGSFEPGGTSRWASSVTVGGTACSLHVQAHNGGADDPVVQIWSTPAPFPSGTTADIVIDYGAGNNNSRTCIGVYSVGGIGGLNNYGWKASQDGGVGNITSLLSAREGGIAIAAFVSKSTASPTITWSGTHPVTKDADINLSGSILSVASGVNLSTRHSSSASIITTSSAPNNADSQASMSYIPP